MTSRFLSTLLNDSHLCPPLVNSSHGTIELCTVATQITHAAAAARNLEAAIPRRSTETAKRNRSTRSGNANCSSKTGSRRQSEKIRFWSTFSRDIKRKNHQRQNAETPGAKASLATFMQPRRYDLRLSAAKGNTVVLCTAEKSLYATTPLRFADAGLQNTLELRATVAQIAAPKPDAGAKAKKDDFGALF